MAAVGKAWRRLVAAQLACILAVPAPALANAPSGAALPAAPASARLWLREPATQEVAWRGMLRTEGSGVGSGTFLGPYPAFGVIGFLAAVLTHAAISQGSQSAERKREQEDADKVLDVYKQPLQAWSATDLWSATLSNQATPDLKLWDGKLPVADGTSVEALPVFTLAQDHSALFLDAAMKLVPAPGAAPVSVVVRVLSSPLLGPDGAAQTGEAAQSLWAADDARRLKAVAAGMLAHALQLGQLQLTLPAVEPAGAEASAASRTGRASARPDTGPSAPAPAATPVAGVPTRTYRYAQGGAERTERAQQVGGDCRRAVLRTLRGALFSVPLSSAAVAAAESPCQAAVLF
jgi:hypothetical protein